MKGLIIKDILNMRKNLKTTMLVSLFFIAYAFGTNNPFYVIAMLTILFALQSLSSMSYDEMTKWDGYALSLPISRTNIVASKYLLAIALALGSVVISSLLAYLFILPKTEMDSLEMLLVSYLILSIALIYISLTFPFVYKFGIERSRIITVAIFALPMAIIMLAVKAGGSFPSEDQLWLMLKLSPLALILMLAISFSISLKIFKNKEL